MSKRAPRDAQPERCTSGRARSGAGSRGTSRLEPTRSCATGRVAALGSGGRGRARSPPAACQPERSAEPSGAEPRAPAARRHAPAGAIVGHLLPPPLHERPRCQPQRHGLVHDASPLARPRKDRTSRRWVRCRAFDAESRRLAAPPERAGACTARAWTRGATRPIGRGTAPPRPGPSPARESVPACLVPSTRAKVTGAPARAQDRRRRGPVDRRLAPV